MATRRGFLAGLTAAGLIPATGWADAGAPAYLAAAQMPDGSHRLFGLDEAGNALFDLPLPGRGHAAAAHTSRPEAVAFARRPGNFAVVIDCAAGTEGAVLETPPGRHFMGHGVFSADGSRLYTPENDFDHATGVVGVWDANAGYRRIGQFASGGVGPHDVRLMPDGKSLVIANGGIETHPDSGRVKLNIPFMQPSLVYTSMEGEELERVELDWSLHKNSIRHLALRPDGLIAFAMQWQGDDTTHPPLLGLHMRGQAVRLLSAPGRNQRDMNNYAGSVAISADGGFVAISSPRGGRIHVFDTGSDALVAEAAIEDVCGLSAAEEADFLFTSGTGLAGGLSGGKVAWSTGYTCMWDNHLVPVLT